MKKNLRVAAIPILMGFIVACNFTSTVITPEPSQSTESPGGLTAAPTTNSTSADITVSYLGTSFTIPAGLANGIQNDVVPQANDFSVWPAHTRFTLQGYALQGKTFEPQVLIYPVKEFEQLSPDAGIVITDLQNILAAQRTSPAEPIPFLPNEHAQQVFHAQEKFLSFKNGTGIRYITQFDQAPLPINNTSMFYTFQGLTTDGKYYVSATMPVNLDYLPADDKPNAPTPPNGIPFDWEHIENFPNYLSTAVERLRQPDNPFQPQLETLDRLVESILAASQP